MFQLSKLVQPLIEVRRELELESTLLAQRSVFDDYSTARAKRE
jgi:hypothetical protein